MRENHLFISWPNLKLVNQLNQLKTRIPTSLFLLCKVQAIMCKFIMATMYKCKGKGMTTSKCKSKKALLCVSSKLSSWSRKKWKRRTLCASTKPSSQPTKRAPASESRKSCGRQFLQICERPFVYLQSLLNWLCAVNSNYKNKTISDSTSMFGLKLKKDTF